MDDALVGTPVLGGYIITGVLGAGGMGSVYVAEHQRINKKVAIKVLHSHMVANRDIVQRFLAEARAASALDHPNIIEVIDAATLDDGRDYIALEHLAGEALDDFLRARPQLEVTMALRILAQALCGLEAAHHRGIIHRDLKPANLFIAPTELEPLRVKVLDFGIAKLNDTILAGGVETGTNAVAGTPGYMAPEQARGMKNVDHRADIYAMGAVAYRMITGQTPYDGESLGEIIFQQLSAPPADVRAHRPDIDAGWVDAIMSSLGADPAMRPPSARDLTLRLAAATPGGMDIVRQVAPLFFTPTWIERNRALVEPFANTGAPGFVPTGASGGTATHQPQTAPEVPIAKASHPTTLSSAVGSIPNTAPVPRRNPLVVVGAIGTALAAVVVVIIAIAASSGETSASRDIDAGPHRDGAVAEIPQVDSAPVATPPTTPISATSSIQIAVAPNDAEVSIDGIVTTKRRFEWKRGSEHELVVRKRGFESDRRTVRVAGDDMVEVELQMSPERGGKRVGKTVSADKADKADKPRTDKPTDKTDGPDGPISTEIDSKSKPGPTTDTL